ncbi:MAG TPA: HypC/HybG/HupF family hydrogenase formation chaperone [Acidimicrobiia bacterium]|nr:HypC/HybG/HupF family hydrogenase formation chaperone [Acidimicrobiia bacterium]
MCVAVPGRVVSLGEATEITRPAKVSILGVEREVDLVMVPNVSVGDYVVVHSGYAIEIVPRERARETIEMLGGGLNGGS